MSVLAIAAVNTAMEAHNSTNDTTNDNLECKYPMRRHRESARERDEEEGGGRRKKRRRRRRRRRAAYVYSLNESITSGARYLGMEVR